MPRVSCARDPHRSLRVRSAMPRSALHSASNACCRVLVQQRTVWARGRGQRHAHRRAPVSRQAVTEQVASLSPSAQAAAPEAAAQTPQQRSTYLQSIFIRDFALVAQQTVKFSPGLNVISGESGSGKSVLLSAFNMILGAQATSDLVREPADLAGAQQAAICNTACTCATGYTYTQLWCMQLHDYIHVHTVSHQEAHCGIHTHPCGNMPAPHASNTTRLPAVVEATFSLAPDASAAVGALLAALGLPASMMPAANGGRVRIRREIAKVGGDGVDGESGALSPQLRCTPLFLHCCVDQGHVRNAWLHHARTAQSHCPPSARCLQSQQPRLVPKVQLHMQMAAAVARCERAACAPSTEPPRRCATCASSALRSSTSTHRTAA